MRGHRTGDLGAIGPVGAEALRAGRVRRCAATVAGRLGAGSGCASTRAGGALRDRAGDVLRRGAWRCWRKDWNRSARSSSNRRRRGPISGENGNARPDARERDGTLEARHVVTHSYATKLEFEIKQQRVNKVLRISRIVAELRRVSPAKNATAHRHKFPAPAPATTARNAPQSGFRARRPFAIW